VYGGQAAGGKGAFEPADRHPDASLPQLLEQFRGTRLRQMWTVMMKVIMKTVIMKTVVMKTPLPTMARLNKASS
jgi:hypothetical protein